MTLNYTHTHLQATQPARPQSLQKGVMCYHKSIDEIFKMGNIRLINKHV